MDPREREQAYDDDRALLLDLLVERAFARRKVTLSSGKESDFYINCKKALTSDGLACVGHLFYEQIRRHFDIWISDYRTRDIRGVGGLTMGADPLAVATSLAARQDGHYDLSPFYTMTTGAPS